MRNKSRKKLSKKLLLVSSVIVISGLFIAGWLILRPDKADAPDNSQMTNDIEQPDPEPAYKEIDLQPIVDAWVDGQAATYSIVVYDNQSGNIIASSNPDQVMFAASLYKMFVAYLALEDFESGAQDPDEIIIYGNTRRSCVDLMIRESDSPCGEAMMADMDPGKLEARVKAKGINSTTFAGIQTTATDSVKILELLLKGDDINKENTEFLRDAMRIQDAMYRRGLAKGSPEGIWDTKVGWNLDINYHDIGILTMPDERQFAVAILGQGSGSPLPIADFSSTIYTALNNASE